MIVVHAAVCEDIGNAPAINGTNLYWQMGLLFDCPTVPPKPIDQLISRRLARRDSQNHPFAFIHRG